MEIDQALDLWIEGKLSVKEVYMATGLRKLSAIYQEIVFEKYDLEIEEEFSMSVLIAEMDRDQLEAHAWEKWGDFLKEQPDYLEACVRMLRYERQRQLKEIGRSMTDATAVKTLN
jgi:hypothetical protein